MTTGRAAPAFVIIAILLLLLIGVRSWTLMGLMTSQEQLEKLEERDHEAAPASVLDAIDELEERELSSNQESRLINLRNEVTAAAVVSAFSLAWPDGSKLPLREALRHLVGVREGKSDVKLVLNTQALGDRLKSGTLAGKPIDFQQNSWALPVALGNAEPRSTVELTVKLEDGKDYGFQLNFLLDRHAPQLSFSSNRRETIEAEDGVIGLEEGEELRLKIQDGSLTRRIRVTRDSELIVDRAHERILELPVYRLGPENAGTVAQLHVEAIDWAGNNLDARFELRRHEASAPKLLDAKLGELDLLAGPQRWREKAGALNFHFETAAPETRMSLRFTNDLELPVLAESGSEGRRVDFAFPEGVHHLQGKLVLERYGKEVVLAPIEIIHDANRPRIDLFDAKGAPVLVDAVAIHEGQSYQLVVEDNDVLDARQEVARYEGGIRLDAPTRGRERYKQTIHVEDSGKLMIVARDLAGNVSERAIEFTLTAMLGDDDQKGPEVALYSGETRLDPAQDLLFWKNSGDLELRVSDSAGVDPSSLKLERLKPVTASKQVTAASWSLKVRADADPSVEVADRFGRKSRVTWPIAILDGPAEIGPATEVEGAATLPLGFEWRMRDVAPATAIRCRLTGPDGLDQLLEHENSGGRGQGEIPKSAVTKSGTYRLILQLLTPTGPREIASKSIQIDIPADSDL